ncbi:MAG: exodeoxyribonuclease VII large subunit [Bacteroidales bacterium]|nr:exodeoxyribonuclease VII large subunit [Bacteroidales bacterium]
MTNNNSKLKFLSLSELNKLIKKVLDDNITGINFWVVAEIVNLKTSRGHCYLSLIEKPEGTDVIKAEMRAIIWKDKFIAINSLFKQLTGFELKENIKILFSASVNYDIRYGLSLYINDIEPNYTVGLLQLERQQIIARLKKEGLYERNRKTTFPLVPQNIAVISAEDSKGYEDFKSKLLGNQYNYAYNLTLFSAYLQGNLAAQSLTQQLNLISAQLVQNKEQGDKAQDNQIPFDIVVIVRGGGANIDLNCFNDENLARAIALCPVPVITGIGHTANISIADEVAFSNRITPTDVADFIIQKTFAFQQNILDLFNIINQLYNNIILEQNYLLNKQSQRLNFGLKSYILKQKSKSGTYLNLLAYSTSNFINKTKKLSDELFLKLSLHTKNFIQKQAADNKISEEKIRLLDPEHILRRGYSITVYNDKTLRDCEALNEGVVVKTKLFKGTFISTITKIDTNGKP